MDRQALREAFLAREKVRLQGERQHTLVRIDRLRELLKYEVETSEDGGDPDIYEREKNLALLQTFERKLEVIERALNLVAEGSYGLCERCGERIDEARLEALPGTTLCVRCKQRIERSPRHRPS